MLDKVANTTALKGAFGELGSVGIVTMSCQSQNIGLCFCKFYEKSYKNMTFEGISRGQAESPFR
jgi:hypothetical protein